MRDSYKYGRSATILKTKEIKNYTKIKSKICLLYRTNFYPALLTAIENSKTSIYISVYQAVLKKEGKKYLINNIWRKLKEKKDEGLDVRILINQNFHSRDSKIINQSTAQNLILLKIPVKFYDKTKRGHSKVYIFDNRIAIIGSHNLSERAIRENIEMSIYIEEDYVVKEVEGHFLEEWRKGISLTQKL